MVEETQNNTGQSVEHTSVHGSPVRLCVMTLFVIVTFVTVFFDARYGLGSLLSFGPRVEERLEEKKFDDWDLDVFLRKMWDKQAEDLVLEDGGLRPAAPESHDYRKAIGVYLTPNSIRNEEKFIDTIERTKQAGGNSLIFDVKGSYVYFDSSSPLAQEFGLVRSTYDLPAIVKKAHESGMYVMARFIAIKDPVFSSTVKEVRLRHSETGREVSSVWVDPAHPVTLAYNGEVLRDVIRSGVDEVNFDYIRFPTEYPQHLIAMTGAQKADRLEAFLKMARRIVNEEGLGTKIGISTFAILGWNFELNLEPLGQDIRRLAPYVDIISPMAYPSTFSLGGYYNPSVNPGSRNYWLVYRTMEGYKEILGEKYSAKLRPWIQGYFMTRKGLRDQMQAVYDSGACGMKVWNASNVYADFFAVLEQFEVPERCKVTSVI